MKNIAGGLINGLLGIVVFAGMMLALGGLRAYCLLTGGHSWASIEADHQDLYNESDMCTKCGSILWANDKEHRE